MEDDGKCSPGGKTQGNRMGTVTNILNNSSEFIKSAFVFFKSLLVVENYL